MKNCFGIILFCFSLVPLHSYAVAAVPQVDLPRIYGKWFEQRRVVNDRQDDYTRDAYGPCKKSTMEYAPFTEGRLLLTSTCMRSNSDGSKLHVDKAFATAVAGSNNTKFKVKYRGGFFLFRWLGIGDGDEWILAYGPAQKDGAYSWMVVGSPKLDAGWILSRQEAMPAEELNTILSIMAQMGYQPERLKDYR